MHPVINLVQKNIIYYKDQLLSSLTSQQKQILVIGMAALSFIATLYLFHKYCFTAELKEAPNQAEKSENLKEKVIPKKTPKEEPIVELEEKEEPVELEEKKESIVELKEEEEPAIEPEEEAITALENEELEKAQPKKENEVKLEEEPTLEEEQIVEQDYDENLENEEIPRDEKTRNVLIIGASRTGKTTLRNVLENICHVAPPASIFFSTVKPVLHSPINLGEYAFRILDTPGLCESAPIGKTARSNAEIVQLIEKKVKKHFGGKEFENVDVAIMTFSCGTGIFPEDIESLNTFIPKLDARTKKILVITRTESKTEAWQTQIRDDISRHPKLGSLVDTHFGGKDNIVFFGALDEYNDHKESFETMKKIYWGRESLIKALLPVEEPKDLKKIREEEIVKQAKAFLEAEAEKKKKQLIKDQAAKQPLEELELDVTPT